jgi:hypothetical protein
MQSILIGLSLTINESKAAATVGEEEANKKSVTLGYYFYELLLTFS